MNFTVSALGAEPHGRAIDFEVRHPAKVFDIEIVTDERGMAVLADRKNRSGGFELHGSPAGWAGSRRHVSAVHAVEAWMLLNVDVRGAQESGKGVLPVQRRPRLAAKNVHAHGTVFGECVNRQVRFLEKPDSGDASASRKLMPDGILYRMKVHTGNDSLKKR